MNLLNILSIVTILALYALVIYTTFVDIAYFKNDATMWYNAVYGLMLVLMMFQLGSVSKPLDIKEQFAFYASYHNDTKNKLIHLFFVWPILLTAIWFYGLSYHSYGVFIFALFYAIYYMMLDIKAGSLGAIMVLGWSAYVYLWYDTIRGDDVHTLDTHETNVIRYSYKIAFIIHAAAWIAQFIGHGVFEGRAPALLDNLGQSFVMAPLFVLLEVLFVCGYRQDLQHEVEIIVQDNIRKFKEQNSSSTNDEYQAISSA